MATDTWTCVCEGERKGGREGGEGARTLATDTWTCVREGGREGEGLAGLEMSKRRTATGLPGGPIVHLEGQRETGWRAWM